VAEENAEPGLRWKLRRSKRPNVEHPISNATIFQIGCWALDVERLYSGNPAGGPSGSALADRIVCLTTQKMLQLKACHVC